MAQTVSRGNCYLCGRSVAKSAFKKHLLTVHPSDGNQQKCVMLKVEDAWSKKYWLYLDVAATSSLKTLDTFLRKIWLECCGHMSAFYYGKYEELGMGRKIWSFPDGFSFSYDYDFGDTTQLKITVVSHGTRPQQKAAVRLLGRNEAYHFACQNCGQEADYICTDCAYERDNPFLCEKCAQDHEHGEEVPLPVVNSPRMGVCGYCGELDEYEFDPKKLKVISIER